MAKGRGSAVVAAMVVCLLVLHCEIAQAATYAVGDTGGWTFNVVNWPRGKTFKAGDVLEFNYNPKFHNVVPVDAGSYGSCNIPQDAIGKAFTSGKDHITLKKGQNFFVCSFTDHCDLGMKISVDAV
ncbi:hypothetical protein LguiA_008568 [Lonicera macranthoides]